MLPAMRAEPPWLDRARDQWLPREDRAMRVTAVMRSPVAFDRSDGLRLDGALSFAMVALVTGLPPREAFAGLRLDDWVDLPIPIVDTESAGWRVARCSDAMLPPVATEGLRRRRRKTHVDTLGVAKVMTNGGPWKALDIPTPTVSTPVLSWCLRGDRARLEALLRETLALGRGRAGGLGEVIGWDVEDVADDWSTERDGMPTRPLPVDGTEDALARYPGAVVRVTSVRAPYWHRAVKALSACPVTAC